MLPKMKIIRFKLSLMKFKLKTRIKLFFHYYGWYYPSLEKMISRLKELQKEKSVLFKSNRDTCFVDGQIDIIKTMLIDWYNYKHGKRNK